jgi:hypothetical protein
VSTDHTAANDALVIHLVNYAREAGAPNKGRGGTDERPLAVKGVEINLALPKDRKVGTIVFYTPEQTGERLLDGSKTALGVGFEVPEFLAYAVIRVALTEPRTK